MSRSKLYATAIIEAYNLGHGALTDDDRKTETLVVVAGRRTVRRIEW